MGFPGRFLPRTILAAHVCAACCVTAQAQDTDESIYLSDMPVVLSASRLSQPLRDAPGAVTTLDREQIRASGMRDVTELLRLVPGFIATLPYGSYPVAGYHGLTRDRSNRMLVLIDGRSAYSPYFLGGIEWNHLGVDIDDIERVEVFRGSNSAAYGANAVLGVVNITTRSALNSEAFAIKEQRGGDGIRDRSLAGAFNTKGVGVRLRLREQRDDGFDGFFDGRRIHSADVRSDYQLDNQNRIEFHTGTNYARTARGYPEELGDPPRWQSSALSYGLVRWRNTHSAEREWALTYYHQNQRSRDSFDQSYALSTPPLSGYFTPALRAFYGLPDTLNLTIDSSYRTTRDDIELQRTMPIDSKTRAVWGLGWRQDTLRAAQHFYGMDRVNIQHQRAFGNLEWRINASWLLNAGLMIENSSESGTTKAPRLALNYHAAPGHTLRAAWSRAYRAPTPFEEKSDIRFTYGNTVLRWTDKPGGDLRPEKMTAIELGYIGEVPSWAVSWDVRAFDEKLEDLIQDVKRPIRIPAEQLDPSRTEYRSSINGSWARLYGLEYQLTWRPAKHSWIGLSQTFMNIRSDEPKNLQSAPHIATVLSAAHRFARGFSVSLHHYRYGRMNWQQTEQETISPYHRTDMRLGYELKSDFGRGEIFAVAQYLGKENAEFKPRYKTENRVFAGVRWEY